ncbi:PadR family transcriptional regulator [Caulobacter sp. BE254]|uniref:PadR family transcriptional regulator n=1 Tax=Caulobacter sp. BE254 TaxID=2817720 RepID=UPI00286BCFD7|nr:PadR family transcriptional regulator [Caulobacter sp. BE254]
MPSSTRRLSPQTLAVLNVLVRDANAWFYGLEVSAATGLKSGSLYPILIRLNERGLLESRWLEPERPGRPPRHAYRITAAGRAAAKAASRSNTVLNLKGALG